MSKIKVIGMVNGHTVCSILDSKGGAVVTKKSVEIISGEIKLRYPEIAKKVKEASKTFQVDTLTDIIDLTQLPPSIKDALIREISK